MGWWPDSARSEGEKWADREGDTAALRREGDEGSWVLTSSMLLKSSVRVMPTLCSMDSSGLASYLWR